MKILAMEKETSGVQPEEFVPHLKPEAVHVWELYQGAVIRELYFRGDRSEAVLILECPSLESARQELDGLPLVRAGLISFELIPLIPYAGFARLFANQST